ncbi:MULTISPECIES: restriction endonuclease subunit S [unclassified Flavobacterium]|uniref:restriction endonuclease subunit S n=1 Tax=unclassified Flavobacterium TaxID=196869 RepID=UPI0018F42406|nr:MULTISPECIES: restriction endonuclease subunit S [unclassified Flavobacterium]
MVPELRFKEFEGEWTEKYLGNCIDLLTDYHANGSYERLKENVELLEEENYAVIIRTTNFEKKDFQKNLLYIDENAFNFLKKSKVYPDDIIINKIANAGATYLMPDLNRPVSLAMNLFLLRIKKEHSARYIYTQIKTKEHLLRALASGTGTKTITKQDVRNFEINIPTLKEQQKIASFLSAVDKKIQQLSRRKELLEQYKKGLMQELFFGKLRFKDENGGDYPDWEEKKLGNIVTLLKDGSHGSHKDVPDGKYYLLSAKNIRNGQINIDDDDRKISEADFNAIYKNYSLKENDILLTIVGTIGRLAIYKGEKNISFQRSVAFFRFENVYSNYMFQLMNGNAFQKELENRKVVSAQPGIYLGDLAKISLNIPHFEEQQKIANFLSTIDTKIESVNQQITQTQTFKKGLLQKMFV